MSLTRRDILAMVLTTVLAGGSGLGARVAGDHLEHTTIDWRYAIREDRPASDKLVLVGIDARTGDALRYRFPPARYEQARVVRELTRAGARVIAYDLVLNGVSDDPDADIALVDALERAPAAVVAVVRFDALGNPELLAGIRDFSDSDVRPGNIERLAHRDGTWIRFQPRIGRLDGFPLAVAAAYRNVSPTAPPARALIDYRGRAGHIRRLSFIDVARGRFDPGAVRGKIVVVGPTAPELQDLHDVPVGGRMLGAEINANAIATALDGFPLRASGAVASIRVTLLLGAVVPLLLLALATAARRRGRGLPGSLTVLGLGAGALLAWAVLAQIAFDRGIALELVPGTVALLVATASAWVAAVLLERRRYRALRRRFASSDDEAFVASVVAAEPGDGDLGRLRSLVEGFSLTGIVGFGGMGNVFRATELALGREVALKVINPAYAEDPEFNARFLEEARKAAAVEHPNLVPIYSVGQMDDQLYLAMRLIPGSDLARTLERQGRLDLHPAARLLHRVALALDALHAGGVVHCDVKPANILRSDDDPEHPYLTDFGIARVAGSRAAAGQLAGTPEYVAPEQIRDDDVGPATDIYALGAVFFQCVTGSVPFSAPDRDELLYMHVTSDRPKVSERIGDLPRELDALVARAMAIEPEDRFAAAADFTRAVLDVLRELPDAERSAQPGPADLPGATEPLA